jgi:lipopolysaccharide heptosyltransferase II
LRSGSNLMAKAKEIFKQVIRTPVESAMRVYLSSLEASPLLPDSIERILVFAYHGLGNFILYTPALKLLRERFPQARIDLQVGNNTGCEEVLAGAGLFDNIYNLPYSAGLARWMKRAAEINRTRYDLTINEFHSHSWQLAMLLAISGTPFRIGHVTSPGWSRRFSRYSFVFNLPIKMREDEHEIERYFDLLAPLGISPPPVTQAKTSVHLSIADREFSERFLYGTKGRRPAEIIGIQPGTSPAMRWKQWPVDRYRELIASLYGERQDSLIVLFGSAGEVEMIEDLARGFGSGVVVAAGKTTVKEVAALIEKCDMLICNDSGLMHVAVAVGTPVVAIYGPTDIRRTAPIGDQHTVVRRELPCSPCFRLEGDDQVHACTHHDCLMTIQPREVLQAVSGLRARSSQALGANDFSRQIEQALTKQIK